MYWKRKNNMQVFQNKENIGKLTKTSNTTVQLSSSTITLGAKQYSTSNLTCNPSVSGVGGLDTGSEQSAKYYYVYAVINSGSVVLVCSLSNQKPSGYSTYKKVGAFVNDFDGNVEQVLNIGQQPDSEILLGESIGSGTTNTRFFRFDKLSIRKGIEIDWQSNATLGDKFLIKSQGLVHATASLADTFASEQEIGITINSDAFGITNISGVQVNNPQLIFCAGRGSSGAGNEKNFAGSKFMQANDYLRGHLEQPSSATTGQKVHIRINKEGFEEIDWTDY